MDSYICAGEHQVLIEQTFVRATARVPTTFRNSILSLAELDRLSGAYWTHFQSTSDSKWGAQYSFAIVEGKGHRRIPGVVRGKKRTNRVVVTKETGDVT